MSMNDNRISYPFYTDDGTYRKFLGVIQDMALWVSAGTTFPLRVSSVNPESSDIVITLQDSSDVHMYTLKSDSGYIYDNNGVLSGIVRWNRDEVVSVCATLKGGDPIPWGNVYVLPIVCKIRHSMPLSSVSINGEAVYDSLIRITGDDKAVKTSEDSINLYQYDESLGNAYINKLSISSGSLSETIDVDGYVWLRSDAECDIRVNTESSIKIGTVIEGD